MSIEWPAGMMPVQEFIGSAALHYQSASSLRANDLHAAAAHEETNALICQLAPAIISIAESLATLARVANQCNEEGLRVCAGPLS